MTRLQAELGEGVARRACRELLCNALGAAMVLVAVVLGGGRWTRLEAELGMCWQAKRARGASGRPLVH